MEFSRQENCSGSPFSPPGDLPDPEMEPKSPASPALAGEFFTTEPPGKLPHKKHRHIPSIQSEELLSLHNILGLGGSFFFGGTQEG